MYCPFCHDINTKVIDSRLTDNGIKVKRRRECISCQQRFNTFEVVEWNMPRIIKRDEKREVYDHNKLKQSIIKALEKHSLDVTEIDAAMNRIENKLRSFAEREVFSYQLGEIVMEELKQLDKLAYVRFASVYSNFKDLDALHEFVAQLKK